LLESVVRDRSRDALRSDVLSGWKEIANHLGKGVRTVQRYERELGLPVRHPAHKARGSVIATRAEIDAWVSARPLRDFLPLRFQTSPSHQSTITSLRENILLMQRLREETEALRAQLRGVIEALSTNIRFAQSDAKGAPHNPNPSLASWKDVFPSRTGLAPMPYHLKRSRAS
jgi:hypothetical protein